MWKDFFFFSKGERNGVYILLSLILLVFSVNFCLPRQSAQDREVLNGVASFRDTIFIHDTIVRIKYQEVQKYVQKSGGAGVGSSRQYDGNRTIAGFNYDTVKVELNSLDTTEWKRLRGIGSVLANRIVKYRKRLGSFHSIEQLRDVYGLSEETYLQIAPHIWINDVPLQSQK